MQQDNPLYSEYADEELRVDLFQPPSDEETEGMKISICLLLFTCFTFLFFTHTHIHMLTGDIDEGRLLHAAIHADDFDDNDSTTLI